MLPRRVLLLATSFVLALAAWVSRGAVGLTDAAPWPARIGILPSRWAPPVLAVVCLAALWRARRSTLLVLLVPGVLLLPWLPVPVPAAALIWTGHVVPFVWLFTGLALVAVSWPRWARARAFERWRDPRTGSLAALALAFALFCGAAWAVASMLPGGDEPHYLVITQSLLRDGDLQIENNHQRGDYAEYFDRNLRPDFLRRGKNGEIYSIHAPGLPALVLPAFAVAGYHGVTVFLAFLAALGTWLVWRAGYRLTGSAGAAWFGWATTTLSVPFLVHASMVYPDATGAAIVMVGVTALIACDTDGAGAAAGWGHRRWALVGVALAFLPWLHTRYVGAAAVLGAFVALRLVGRREFGRLAAFAAVPVLSAAAWFWQFYAIYGEFSPAAPYGGYTQSAFANVPRGFAALLFDQQFGALLNGPALVIGILGLGSLVRARRRLGAEVAALFVSYLTLVAAYYMWWGGSSAPARFAVPVLLLLGVPAAVFWSRQRTAGKAVALTALATSSLITASMVFAGSGRLLFNDRDGVSSWLEWLTPVVDLPHAFPSFLRGSARMGLLQALAWVLCLGAGAAFVRASVRRSAPDPDGLGGSAAMKALLALAVSTMVAASATWALERVSGSTPSTSALALLRDFDPAARPVGVRFRPFRRIQIDDLPSTLSLPVSNRRPADAEGALLVLSDVPAGVYRLSPASAFAAQGTVTVSVGRSTQAIARWSFGPSTRGATYQFSLPVGVNAVVLSGDAAARRSLPRVALQALTVAPEVWRFTTPPAARAARYDSLVAFAFRSDAFLEDNGIWVAGATPSPMVFAGTDGSPVVRLLVRNCPVENQVTLRGTSKTDVLDMKPGEVRVVEIPVDRMNGGALVEVTTTRGYRPADVDASTQDRRYLGVWLQNAPR